MSSIGSSGKSDSQDFELNLASIIDCFTVLITFMLASASFLSIGILDAGIAAAGASATDQAPPSINILIEMTADHKATVKVTGKANTTTAVAAKGAEWDFEGLTRNLASLKSGFPDVSAVTLTAENAVEYKDVVKAMEVTRQTMPVVLLGGF